MKEEMTSKELAKIAIARFVVDTIDLDTMGLILKSLSEFYKGRFYYGAILPNTRDDPFKEGFHCYTYILPEEGDV